MKRIHTPPSSYAQKVKGVPQRASRPPAKERVKGEVVVDEPYGEYHVLFPKGCSSNGSQSNGMNLGSSCSRGMSIPKSSRMLRSPLQMGHTSKSLEIISLLTALIPAKAPFYRMFPSPSLPYRARISMNTSTDSALLLPNPGWALRATLPPPLSPQSPTTGAYNLVGQSTFIKMTVQVITSP